MSEYYYLRHIVALSNAPVEGRRRDVSNIHIVADSFVGLIYPHEQLAQRPCPVYDI